MNEFVRNSLFRLRSRGVGRLKLRRNLPQIVADSHEEAFYSLLLDDVRNHRFDVVCDVGCRNWSYVGALRRKFPEAKLIGIELDGYRRYLNLWRRVDYANAFAARNDAVVFATDYAHLRPELLFSGEQAVLFSVFFPFVSENPCVKWGLPVWYANYSTLVAKMQRDACKAQSTWLLSCHQGIWEAEIAEEIYTSLGVTFEKRRIFASQTRRIWPSPHDTYVFFLKVSSKPS